MIRASTHCLVPVLLVAGSLAACSEAPRTLQLEVWHGNQQRVGHLGDAQDDFNLMGTASAANFRYTVNGEGPYPLELGEGRWGFRRLGGEGHFNADIPIERLLVGENRIELLGDGRGEDTIRGAVTLTRSEGGAELPFSIRWNEVQDPQEVGQYVDGRWERTEGGLRAPYPAYDRLFLIGNRTWRDYDVRSSVTVHMVTEETSPVSGGNGLGVLMRFQGHTVGGPNDFPDDQPKWGYLPFGAIAWLRWTEGEPARPPAVQYYRGDRNELTDHGTLEVVADATYALRAECRTMPDDATGSGVTRYRFKVWPAGEPEPDEWRVDVTQTSDEALRSGGLCLIAHHVDVTFGDVEVTLPEGD